MRLNKVSLRFAALALTAGLFLSLSILSGCTSSHSTAEGETLNLVIEGEGWDRINAAREVALKTGINQSADWEAGTWTLDGSPTWRLQSGTMKARLKGDWNDHLKGKQWSFRIKLKGQGRFMGMKSFSIMRPSIRGMMDEYMYHRLLRSEDILATRYDFAPVSVNRAAPRLYAIEEHFRKELVESLGRRESPMLKLDEKALWSARATYNKELEKLPIDQAAEIVPFTPSNLEEEEVFRDRFIAASGLLHALRYETHPVEDLIDVEKWARFLAIVDLTEAYHSLIWHNLRFYFNPVTHRLEPVGYDGFNENGAFNWLGDKNVVLHSDKNAQPLRAITGCEAVREAYRDALALYTSSEFLDQFEKDTEAELAERLDWLQAGSPGYSWDFSNWRERAAMLAETVDQEIPSDPELTFWANASSGWSELPMRSDVALSVWHEPGTDSIYLESFAPRPIRVISAGRSEVYQYPMELELPAYTSYAAPQRFALPVRNSEKWSQVSFTDGQSDSIYVASVRQIAPPPSSFPRYSWTRISDSVWSGDRVISEMMYLPAGQSLHIAPGSSIRLQSGGGIVADGALHIEGSTFEGTAGNYGLTALGGFVGQDVSFRGMDALNNMGWTQMGGVTCFGSDSTIMQDCRFLEARSEDALNCFGTAYKLTNIEIRDTWGDGLDVDFGSGTLEDFEFDEIGNDALDLSGTSIRINDLRVKGSFDKGISIGEGSQVLASGVEVQNVVVGISIKDGSSLATKGNLQIGPCQLGLVAFRKKPEYDPASVELRGIKMNQVRKEAVLEAGTQMLGAAESALKPEIVEKVELSEMGY